MTENCVSVILVLSIGEIINVTLSLMSEFEDIPNEVSHLLKFTQEELSFACKRIENVSSKLLEGEPNAPEALELLHSIRIQMAKVDSRMEDCMSILNGYQYYIDNPDKVPVPEEQVAPEQEEQIEEGDEKG